MLILDLINYFINELNHFRCKYLQKQTHFAVFYLLLMLIFAFVSSTHLSIIFQIAEYDAFSSALLLSLPLPFQKTLKRWQSFKRQFAAFLDKSAADLIVVSPNPVGILPFKRRVNAKCN